MDSISDKYDLVVALQPDHPDREHTLDYCIDYMVSNNYDDLITIESNYKRSGSVRIFKYEHLMNNNVLVSTPDKQLLYVPFTLLSYYKTEDKHTCKEAERFLTKQLQNSKLLNTAGEKERNSFFNKLYSKIEALKQLIEATQVLDFE